MRPEIGDFKCERAQLKITRTLRVIDLLASFTHPKTSTEIGSSFARIQQFAIGQ